MMLPPFGEGRTGQRQSQMGLKGAPHLPSSIRLALPWERYGILISIPLPWGEGGTARRGVRGFFARDAIMAMEVCDARNFDGTLGGQKRAAPW
jgi:hypothetical protein